MSSQTDAELPPTDVDLLPSNANSPSDDAELPPADADLLPSDAELPPAKDDAASGKSLKMVPKFSPDTDGKEFTSLFAVNFANSSSAFQTNFPQPGFRVLGMFKSEEAANAAFQECPPNLETIFIPSAHFVKISPAGVTDVPLTDVLFALQKQKKVQPEYPKPLMFPPESSTTHLYNDEAFVAIEVIASHVKDEFYIRFVALKSSQEEINGIAALPMDEFATIHTGSFYSLYHFT